MVKVVIEIETMSERATLSKLFKENLLSFLKILQEYVANSKDLYEAENAIEVGLIPTVTIIDNIARKLDEEGVEDEKKVNVMEKIKNRDETFFLDDKTNFFASLNSKGKALEFKALWQDPSFTQQNKDAIWEWVEILTEIVHSYKLATN